MCAAKATEFFSEYRPRVQGKTERDLLHNEVLITKTYFYLFHFHFILTMLLYLSFFILIHSHSHYFRLYTWLTTKFSFVFLLFYLLLSLTLYEEMIKYYNEELMKETWNLNNWWYLIIIIIIITYIFILINLIRLKKGINLQVWIMFIQTTSLNLIT